MKQFKQLREAIDKDISSMDDKAVASIANNPKHPMHSAAKAEHDRRKMKQEAKDPEEYDNEGSMMKSQLRQICSANEKLMGMVKDDDNLPEWVQSKVTKATDYIRSVRDYLESEKMEEKTLTPAELKKREEIAQAIKRDNPDMPMDKKMAIATSQAKKVAEGKIDEISIDKLARYGKAAAQDVRKQRDRVRSALDQPLSTKHQKAGMAAMKTLTKRSKGSDMYVDKMTNRSKVKPSVATVGKDKKVSTKEETVNEVSKEKLFNYMRKSAADVSKARGDARRQDKRIGGQKKADDKIRAMQGKRDASHIKVPATEGKARDRLIKMVDRASGRTMADREKDAAAATARRKEAEKDHSDFKKKNKMS